MATLHSLIDFTGTIGNITAFKRNGTGKTYLRQANGPTRKQILQAPAFQTTRELNNEFRACTMLTAGIRRAIYPLKHLGDANFTGALNKLAKKIQTLDTTGIRGERNIYLSRHRHMLKGCSLHQERPFDGILRHPVSVQPDRENASATVLIPAIIPDVNLFLAGKGLFSRFVITLSTVGDVLFTDKTPQRMDKYYLAQHHTPWLHMEDSADAATIDLQLGSGIPEQVSLVLGIGIETGRPDRFGEMELMKKNGSAKILEVF